MSWEDDLDGLDRMIKDAMEEEASIKRRLVWMRRERRAKSLASEVPPLWDLAAILALFGLAFCAVWKVWELITAAYHAFADHLHWIP